MIGVGVIGYGYWGPNLVRNYMELPGAKVVAVADTRKERLALAQTRYPSITTTTDPRELIRNPAVDAVIIATPVSSHFDLAIEALKENKHVLVEKPLTASSAQAKKLIEESERRKKVLLVDHTFTYTGAVRKMRELVTSGQLGDIYYYDSVRVNLGLFQHDVNVIWDLAVHDLSIMDFVLGSRPVAVSATGISHVPGKPENVAYLTCYFDRAVIAHVHASWLAPVKVRRTMLGGSAKMVIYDDLEPSEKIKVYDKGINVKNDPESIYKMLIQYRTGDMWAPQIEGTEALRVEALHFVKAIEEQRALAAECESGLRVVEILEAATTSMAERGRPVELEIRR
jgi:predicted dehydrogenase